MPIIRLEGAAGGGIGAAGQAAAAFDQGTADTRRAMERRRFAELKIAEQQRRELLELGRQAEQTAYNRRQDERQFQLQERSMRERETRPIRQQLARLGGMGGMPTGQGVLSMLGELNSLNPEAAQAIDAQFDQATGGRFANRDVTAADLDADPTLRDSLYSQVGGALLQAQHAQNEQAIQGTFESFVESVEGLDPQFLQTPRGQRTLLELQETLADPNITPREAETATRMALSEVNMRVGLRRDQTRYGTAIEDMIAESDAEPDDKRKAREIAASIYRVQDPRSSYLKAKAILDPDARLIAAQAYRDGMDAGAGRAAAGQVTGEDGAAEPGTIFDVIRGGAQEAIDASRSARESQVPKAAPMANEVPSEPYGPEFDPAAVPVDSPVGKALRPPSPDEAREWNNFLDRHKVDREDVDALRAAAEKFSKTDERLAENREKRRQDYVLEMAYGTRTASQARRRIKQRRDDIWERRRLAEASPEAQDRFLERYAAEVKAKLDAEYEKHFRERDPNALAGRVASAVLGAPGAAASGVASAFDWIFAVENDDDALPAGLEEALERRAAAQ